MSNTVFLTFSGWDILSFSISVIMLCIAAIVDLKTMKIPNTLTFTCIFLGILLCAIGNGFVETGMRTLVTIILFALFMTGLLSGGDTKLLMALTFLSGIPAMLFSVIIANVTLLLFVALHSKDEALSVLQQGLFLINRPERWYEGTGRKIAFAPYLLVGFVLYQAAYVLLTAL